METIKKFIRKPLAKIVARAIAYGLTTWLGVEAANAETNAAAAANGVVAAVFFLAGALLDLWHNKKDRNGK